MKTYFEELAESMNVKVETDKDGLYTGMTKALADCANEVILSDDPKVFYAGWNKKTEMIKDRFYKLFPYMKSR